MSQPLCDRQFRIVGSAEGGKRILVDADTANAAYASCNPVCELHKEAYLSCFWYGADMDEHIRTLGSTKGFDGPVWSPFLYFDIDREGDLELAQQHTKRLINWLQDIGAKCDVWFSGSKGFCVATPLPHNKPSAVFNRVCRRMAESIAAYAEIGTIDTAIYAKVQPLRAPNSTHHKTRLHKRRLSRDELFTLTITEIKELAKTPAPYEWRLPTEDDGKPLRGWWGLAERDLPKPPDNPEKTHDNVGNGARTALNRATIEFIKNGAAPGKRAKLLYSSAANLAEFNCPPALAIALLTPAASDSGLPPNEIRRQIECGLKDGGVYE